MESRIIYKICLRGNKEIEINSEVFEFVSKLMLMEKPLPFFSVAGIMVNTNSILWMGPVEKPIITG